MLNGIPASISPELLKILHEMGHGDTLVIGDINVAEYDRRGAEAVGFTDRFSFYEAAKHAYAVISTSETAFYACIIIQKGCL